ncbi:MAG: LuxR C-terminal-related transcriptional regulator [Treponema sp.]|nr:LuxR C-terminal-related transcriptional regulator [Treponema sp.]
MIKPNLYDGKLPLVIRIASIVSAVFLLATNIYLIISGKTHFPYYSKQLWNTINILINFFVIFLLVITAVFPTKIEILSIICFIYSVIILIFEPENQIGNLMFLAGVEILHIRGFFIKKKFIKNSIFFGIYLLLVFTEIRFGFSRFFIILLEKIAYLIIMLINLTCTILYYHFYYEKKTSPGFYINQFQELNIRDAEWLVLIQNRKTYKEIASKYNISEGTVRNRMNRIFKIIKCGDKIGFINLYGDYKIFFGEKEICEEKNISNFEEI